MRPTRDAARATGALARLTNIAAPFRGVGHEAHLNPQVALKIGTNFPECWGNGWQIWPSKFLGKVHPGEMGGKFGKVCWGFLERQHFWPSKLAQFGPILGGSRTRKFCLVSIRNLGPRKLLCAEDLRNIGFLFNEAGHSNCNLRHGVADNATGEILSGEHFPGYLGPVLKHLEVPGSLLRYEFVSPNMERYLLSI